MDWFKNYRQAVKETFGEDLAKEEAPSKPSEPAEEWIWIDGYKGTVRGCT